MDAEIQLLQASREGDAAAFEQIVRKYQSLICAITFSGTGRLDVSEELAQETFLSAWKNLRQLKELGGFRAWLCTIARNLIHSHYRRRKTVSLASSQLAEVADPTGDPSEILIRQEEQMLLEEALMRIPDKYREPLVMYYRQRQSTQSVAAALEINESTVRTRLQRARQMLREEVAARLERTLERTDPKEAFTRAVMAGVAGLAIKGATTAAAAGLASAGSTPTGVGAFLGTVAGKVIVAAASVAVGIGGAVAYQSTRDSVPSPEVKSSVVTVSRDLANDEPRETVENHTSAAMVNVPLTKEAEAVVPEETVLSYEEAPAAEIDSSPTVTKKENESAVEDELNHREGVLGLKVISKSTGEAIADARVQVGAYGDATRKSEGKTDLRGRYDIEVGDKPLRALRITVTSDGHVPTKMEFRSEAKPVAAPLNYTLTLEEGTAIGGLIVNEAGEPIEGATVYLLVTGARRGEQPWILPWIWDHAVQSDAEGQWQCDIVPSKLDDIMIRLVHPEYINDERYGSTPAPTIEALRKMTGMMIMKRGLEVAGVVTDLEGNPIEDAFVAQGSDRFGSHYPDTRTNAQGRFHFASARPGEMVLTVSAKGKSPDLKTLEVRTGMEEVRFALGPGHVLRGRVVDPQGHPIAGAFAAADTWRGHRSNRWRVDTDAAGRFQWNEAPADEVLFDFGKSGYMSTRDVPLIVSPDVSEYEIIMYPPVRISGRVVDAQTGEPVPSFRLVGGIQDGEDESVWWNSSDTSIFKDGQFEKILGEPRYGYALRVEADGYQPSISRVFHPDEERVELAFALERGDQITGVVRLPDGTPVVGAEVVISTETISVDDGLFSDKREKTFCETDAQGRFAFPPQGEAFVVVALHEAGWGICRGVDGNVSQITLEPWSCIEGTVYVGRQLGAGQRVTVHYDYDSNEPSVYFSSNVTADSQGRFEMSRVRAGMIQIGREVRFGESQSTYTDYERLEVLPGQTLEVRIGGKGRPLTGRFVMPAGSPRAIDWKQGWIHLAASLEIEEPTPIYPEGFVTMSQTEQQRWRAQWYQSDEMEAYRQARDAALKQRRFYEVIVNEDGRFRCESVEGGHYQLKGTFREPSNDWSTPGKELGSVELEVNVPVVPEEGEIETLDLGDVEVVVFDPVEIGEPVPDFEFTAADGSPKKVSDYRGRVLLLDMWRPKEPQALEEGFREIGQLYERFGADPRFVILSATDDGSTPPQLLKQFIEMYHLVWEMGLYKRDTSMINILRDYGVEEYPCRLLIGPGGELLGRELKEQDMVDAVAEALQKTGT